METTTRMTERWTKQAQALLQGRTIKRVRYLTDEEANDLGWGGKAVVMELDSGLCVYASQDDEGNGPGALFTTDEKCPTLPVI